ncbi:hypothetical protein QBC39DRAFT_852 [Podospora conica]|nr:hypothetical protein QBC39DRAFT_852 [Schizothecium conicum]
MGAVVVLLEGCATATATATVFGSSSREVGEGRIRITAQNLECICVRRAGNRLVAAAMWFQDRPGCCWVENKSPANWPFSRRTGRHGRHELRVAGYMRATGEFRGVTEQLFTAVSCLSWQILKSRNEDGVGWQEDPHPRSQPGKWSHRTIETKPKEQQHSTYPKTSRSYCSAGTRREVDKGLAKSG